jgi:riboflavin synthase
LFTGLIREKAIVSLENDRLKVTAKYTPNVGDSIAINGACLTAIFVAQNYFYVNLSHETKNSIAVENLNGYAHIEAAMKLGDRIEGHILQGHIDTIGTIVNIEKIGENSDLTISVPKEKTRLISKKGSIAIDGVSLTIAEVYEDKFKITLIDHTLKNMLFTNYNISRRVNIETDMFARYTERILTAAKSKPHENWERFERLMSTF